MSSISNEQIFTFILQKDISNGHRMKSIINKNERTASLFIYYSHPHKDYMFKDFSSGLYGNGILFTALYMFDGSIEKAIEYIEKHIKEIRNIKTQGYKKTINTTIKNIISSLSSNNILKEDNNIIYKNLINRKAEYYKYFIEDFGISYNSICKYNVSYAKNDNGQICYYYINERGNIIQKYNPYCPRDKGGRFKNMAKNITPYGIGLSNEKTTNIILCSSAKDMLAMDTILHSNMLPPQLKKYDINQENTICITMLSEKPVSIKYDILPYGILPNLKRLLILYDNDITGYNMANKIANENSKENNIEIHIINNICHPYKDISDYLGSIHKNNCKNIQ